MTIAMQRLAKEMNDSETQIKTEQLANRMKNNFDKILFNDDLGYFVASADSKTMEQRDVYTSMSIKWDNNFCYDLVEDKCVRMIDFFENNFTCNAGLLPVPVLGKGYDLDANQMHCYWPSNGEIYSRLINFANRKDLIEQFIGWISCWTDILMCPEGIDCYDNINEPKPDDWNALNGTWQAYSIRAWYEAIVHSVVGVDFAENGMNIYPYDGEEMTLKNLHFAGKVTLSKILLTAKFGEDGFSFPIYASIPNKGENIPFFVHINFSDKVPDMYLPIEEISDRGFAVLSFWHEDVSRDEDMQKPQGLYDVMFKNVEKKENHCGKIGLCFKCSGRLLG